MADQLTSDDCLADDYNGTVAIAALAGYSGQEELAGTWWSKTVGYRQFYDPAQQVFVSPSSGFVGSAEGSRYTYVWYNAMWDPAGLATLLGGYEPALGQLRGYFTSTRVDFKNENDLHTPFIATLWGDPGLTRSTLQANVPNMFQDNSPQGRSGNDDCGTMSAWLVLVQSGLYSFNPAWGWYVLTAPAFPRVEMDLGRGGKRLVITANSTNEQDVIQQVKRDGVVRAEPWLLAADICNGGQLDFTLGPGPSSWAENPSAPPLPFPLPQPVLTGFSIHGTTLSLSAINGSPGGTWALLQSTNVALPLSQWETHCTGTYDGNGSFSTNILNAATNNQQFYILTE
jgi:putative alpha-1,2-mannosidase